MNQFKIRNLLSRKYGQFLKQIADFGHGVFTLTMIENSKERDALKKWLHRNPTAFYSFNTPKGMIKIFILSKSFMREIEAQDTISQASLWPTYLDMCLINSYMIEMNQFSQYINKPHLSVDLNDKKVGLISFSWSGPCNPLSGIDALVTVKDLKDYYLNEIKRNKDLDYGIERQQVIYLIKNAYIPKAFRHFRQ